MARTNPKKEQPQQTPAATNPYLQDGAAAGPELIAQRAYELYEARGREQGRDQDDWYEAERQLKGPARKGARG